MERTERTWRRRRWYSCLVGLGIGACVILPAHGQDGRWTCETARQPSVETLTWFLRNLCYRELGWTHDVAVRQTGPTIDGTQYGVHGNVRVYYPPEAVAWLQRGRSADEPMPDGTLLVKEQYSGSTAESPGELVGWTFMFKNHRASLDGWFWGYVDKTDDAWNVGEYFLPYCINCHAGAQNDQLTFAALANVEAGYGTFTNVDTGRRRPDAAVPVSPGPHRAFAAMYDLSKPAAAPDRSFLARFDQIGPLDRSDITSFPDASNDHVVPAPDGPDHFLTSDVCSACHDANSTLKGKMPEMMLVDAEGEHLNLSPYGEWSASVMGLRGRDPIFHAQLESEKAMDPDLAEYIDNRCYRYHGAMGQRQLHVDRGEESMFRHAMVYATGQDRDAKYGAIARDGVSCAVCNHMSDRALGEAATFTG